MAVTKTIVVVALRRTLSYFNYAPLNKLRQLIRSSDTVLPLAIGVFLREVGNLVSVPLFGQE